MPVVMQARKKLVAPEPDDGLTQTQLPFDEVGRADPAEKIRNLARGFRLGFSGLGEERKVSDADKNQLLRDLSEQQRAQMRLTKKLFAKHPALKALSTARGIVKRYFEAKTIPFPEDSVRILILNPPRDAAGMSEEDVEKHFADQASAFREEMRKIIVEKHDAAVQQLQASWEDVLGKARQELGDRFEAANYPSQESLPVICTCSFEAYNVELSKDWQYLSKQERENELAVIRQKFEASVAKQEEFVIDLLNDAISQMLESLTGYQNKETKCFKSSVVQRVFQALDEFKRKTVRFGILKDTEVERIFGQVRKVLTASGTEAKHVPDLLRKSEQARGEMIEKMKSIGSALSHLVQSGQVRRKLVRR